MNFELTPEQEELARAARGFLASEMPVAEGRGEPDVARTPPEATPTAVGLPEKWPEIAALGWLGLGVPEGRGGAGGSLVDQALLFRELGRGLAPGPWLGTVLGVEVARRAARDEIGAALMEGRATARLAEPWRYPASSVRRDTLGGRFRVVDYPGAEWVVFLGPNGAALVHTSEASIGGSARALEGPDPSVPVELWIVDGARPEAVVTAPDATHIDSHGRVLAAAMLVGVLEATRDASVAYAGVREQFGKPIGSFQAVKHRCADMAVRAEAAGSLLWLAALSVADRRAEANRLATAAKALASEYAVQSAHDNVQNHGGLGFTAECSAHLYVKRALHWSVTLGSSESLLAEVARS